MNPEASTVWRRPRWMLAALLACLSSLGPFSIDTYLPAFTGIAQALGGTPVQMQQTLSSYLLAFALMNLFHGALSDSLGRRPVVLVGLSVFGLASAGCATADSVGALVMWRALQGMSAGAGMVVARAVIRDLFAPDQAQRVMSQVTLFFGVAPALAPWVGGLLFAWLGWQAVFWFLCGVAGVLLLLMWRSLPESLHLSQRQPFSLHHLMHGYRHLLGHARFIPLALASAVPFNGMFIYVMSAPVFLGELLGLPPTRFFWLFLLTIGGIMGGAWWSGRLAGRLARERQIRRGFRIMGGTALLNLGLALALPLHPAWALPLIALYALGWALVMPAVTLLLLDLVPERRGMASSLQACFSGVVNALVAGALAPLVMHSAPALALAALALALVGWLAWRWVGRATRPAAP